MLLSVFGAVAQLVFDLLLRPVIPPCRRECSCGLRLRSNILCNRRSGCRSENWPGSSASPYTAGGGPDADSRRRSPSNGVGRPMRAATRAATAQFRHRAVHGVALPSLQWASDLSGSLPTVPRDSPQHLRALVVSFDSRKATWLHASAPRAKPSSISGSRGSERRRQSCGNACHAHSERATP